MTVLFKQKSIEWVKERQKNDGIKIDDLKDFQVQLDEFLKQVEIRGDYFGFYLLSDIVTAYQLNDSFHFWIEVEKVLKHFSNKNTLYLKHLNLLFKQFIEGNP